jgi:predicted transcriptional regulator
MRSLDANRPSERSRVVLMSIKPEFWVSIAAGTKRFELRRRPPRVETRTLVVVYASAPTKALVGTFRIGALHAGPVTEIWNRFGTHFGIDNKRYREYFSGLASAWAIEIAEPTTFPSVTLSDLRLRVPGFRPPQSFMYWHRKHAAACRDEWNLDEG